MEKKTVKICTLSIILILTTLPLTNLSVEGQNTDQNEKEKWVVIICGGTEDNPKKGRAGAESIRNSARHAYKIYKQLGYCDDHIYYLHDRNKSAEGVDGIVKKSTVSYAINKWLASHSDKNDDCCIVFNGHGGRSLRHKLRAYISVWNNESREYEKIFDWELDTWLDKLEFNICTVVIDACFSGGFIKSLSQDKRIIITSTSPFTIGVALKEEVFTYFFFNKLAEKDNSYGEAWEYADKCLLQKEIPKKLLGNADFFIKKILEKIGMYYQNPQIDDNGDGRGHGRIFFTDQLPIRGDGTLALNTYP